MDTHPTRAHHLTLAEDHPEQAEPAGGLRWRDALDRLAGFWRTHPAPQFLRDNWLLAAAGLLALAVVGLLLWLAWLLITTIVAAAGHGAHAAGGGLNRLGGWLAHGPITHTINDPVRAWLDTHTGGLPATGRDLWLTWLITTGLLYLAALAGSTYARIGWPLIGALTAATAYAGAPTGAGPAAAGATAAVWLLLSLPVYARARRASVLEQLALDLAARRDDHTPSTPSKEF